MVNHLQRAFKEIDTAPLYFISTHGFYDMNKYTTGTPYLTTVPENTIVIETSTIGNYCLFINILSILGEMLENRDSLVRYLGGDYIGTPLTQKIVLTALSTCQFYLPGGTIANRVLEATGGIFRRHSASMESERTGFYGNMGFYKYTPGNPKPENIFKQRYSELISGAYGSVEGRGLQVNTSSIPFETFETMFKRINEFGDTFKIIFFSSCGEIRDTEPSSIRIIQQIRDIQKESVTTWNEKMRVNYNESRLLLKDIPFKEGVGRKFGLTSENYVPHNPRNFSEPQIPPLSMTLRSANNKGGTRRFVKKSKRNFKRKNRTIKFRRN
jgi:hypothetical protein